MCSVARNCSQINSLFSQETQPRTSRSLRALRWTHEGKSTAIVPPQLTEAGGRTKRTGAKAHSPGNLETSGPLLLSPGDRTTVGLVWAVCLILWLVGWVVFLTFLGRRRERCHSAVVEVREEVVGVGSRLPSCGSED